MSGIRNHKLYTVTVKGKHEFYPRDQDGSACGPVECAKFTSVKRIIAPLKEIAEAHARYWLRYSSVFGEYELTIDDGVEIDAFIEEHVYR